MNPSRCRRRALLAVLPAACLGAVGLHGRRSHAAGNVEQAVNGTAPATGRPRPTGLLALEANRADEGLMLAFVVAFELPRVVEDALLKGVPLHFTAQAQLMRERWYWTDRRVNTAQRTWRLAYQPLTRRFRIGSGGLAQTVDTLDEALATVGRISGWKVAEPSQLEDGSRHYLEFTYRLDTSLLPRPMQIGIGGQPDWALAFERTLRLDG
jgi:hypothetical protein